MQLFVSVERLILGALAAAVLALGIYVYRQPAPAYAQPSVPSFIPPPYVPRVTPRLPFSVTCPNCRSVLTVQPSANGETGELVKPAVVK